MAQKHSNPFGKVDWLTLAAILLVAAVFRLSHIADHPAGILTDSAINGIDAWRLAHRGGLVPFLFANGGRESLFVYWESLFVALFGTTNLAIRLPGVLVDIGTVAAVFLFTRWLTRDRWTAIFAGVAAATSFWLIPISRLGFRAILIPPLTLLAVWLLLLAWQRHGWRWFALAGGALGALGYTYTAARVMPLMLLAFLPEMIPFSAENRAGWRRHWAEMSVLTVLAALVFSPMWLYLKPFSAFSARTGDVALWQYTHSSAELTARLWESALRSVGYFCCVGNAHLPLFGLNQPAFLLGTGIFVLAGIVLALLRSQQLPYRMLWVWWAIGLLPGILAIEAPHALRLIVAAPSAFVLLGVSMGWVARKKPWFRWVGILWLAIAASFGFIGFYNRWAESPQVAKIFNAEKATQAREWLARTRAGETLFVPQSTLAGHENAPLRFYLLGDLPSHAGRGNSDSGQVSAVESVVRLGGGSLTLLSPADVSSGKIPTRPLAVEIPPLTLVSAAYPFTIPADGQLPVTLFWQTAKPLAEDYLIVLQLLDDARRVWSTDDAAVPTGGTYPPRLWRARTDTVPDARVLHLKDNLPPGRYQLAIAVYDSRIGRRLSLGDGSGDTVFIAPLKVPLAAEAPPAFSTINAKFDDIAKLDGFQLSQTDLSAGTPLTLTLLWRVISAPTADFTVFVHILDENGAVVGGQDNQPVQNTYPTSIWDAGERIVDPYTVVTDGLAVGQYRLAVGMYNAETNTRVSITGTSNGQAILPQTITIHP